MAFLLDDNVLIALIDPSHIHHDPAHQRFAASGRKSWATCLLTENAVVRISVTPAIRIRPEPAAVASLVASICALPGRVFWPDDISLLDAERFDPSRLLSSNQVTDSYLLALACAHGGKLATFDRHLVTDAVPGGIQGLHLIH